jgi:hypothetical protein
VVEHAHGKGAVAGSIPAIGSSKIQMAGIESSCYEQSEYENLPKQIRKARESGGDGEPRFPPSAPVKYKSPSLDEGDFSGRIASVYFRDDMTIISS